MAKYRLLNTRGYSSQYFQHMQIYDDNYMGASYPVSILVANFPFDWELTQEEPMCTEKTIIGYKLIKPEYEKVAAKALSLSSVYSPNMIITGMIGYYVPKIKELGIMDWFEPVYEKAYPEISINGYRGEFFDWGVKFGYAEISKTIFVELDKLNILICNGDDPVGSHTNKEIESVTIGKGTFTKDQIKEIAEYYLKK